VKIEISGLVFKNPVWIGSSELTMTFEGLKKCIDSGAGAVVAKSINESAAAREQLQIADYAFVDNDFSTAESPHTSTTLFNRSGLAPVSLDDWKMMLAEAQTYAHAHDCKVIGSITVGDPKAAPELCASLSEVVPAIELNIGAPHGREVQNSAVSQLTDGDIVFALVKSVKERLQVPLITKLPGGINDVVELARKAQAAGSDAVSMTGRFNGFIPDVETMEPLLGSWGAYSGPWALPISMHAVSKTYKATSAQLPIIGTNGVRTADDVVRMFLSGATAVELVTAVWKFGPGHISRVLSDLRHYMERNEVRSPRALRGVAVTRAKEYADLPRNEGGAESWKKYFDG
jgi:dihydroorotate dehydrogenase